MFYGQLSLQIQENFQDLCTFMRELWNYLETMLKISSLLCAPLQMIKFQNVYKF